MEKKTSEMADTIRKLETQYVSEASVIGAEGKVCGDEPLRMLEAQCISESSGVCDRMECEESLRKFDVKFMAEADVGDSDAGGEVRGEPLLDVDLLSDLGERECVSGDFVKVENRAEVNEETLGQPDAAIL